MKRPDGKTVDLVYNAATGRIETIAIFEDEVELGTVSFTYYPDGQPSARKLALVTAVDGGTLQFSYDGTLLTGTTWTGTVSGSVGFGYNNNFQLSSETVNGQNTINRSYDQDGLLKQAGALILHRDDPAKPETKNGLLRGTTLSNVTTTVDYNEFGEIKDFSASSNGQPVPVTLFEGHYTVRDKLGRIKEKTETVLGVTTSYKYEYDVRGRLWKVFENGSVVRQYQYDANGNRLLFKADESLDTLYDDQDRLLRYGTTTYTYTANGDLKTKTAASDQTTTYTYDVFGNLTHVSLPNGTVIDYVIDGANRRIGKKMNNILVKGFLYADQLKPVAELDGNNNVVSRFIYGSRVSVPDYVITQTGTYRIISDYVGSPRLVIEVETGQVAQRLEYDEFGRILMDTNPGFQPFGFAGGIYDSDTGLVRFGVRDFDPEPGRWTTKDPLLFVAGSTNLYTYAHNDPLSFIDHSGARPKRVKFKRGTMIVVINAPVMAAPDGIIEGETLIDGLACNGASISYCEDLVRKQEAKRTEPITVLNGPDTCSSSTPSGFRGPIPHEIYETSVPSFEDTRHTLVKIAKLIRRGKKGEAAKFGAGLTWRFIMGILGGPEDLGEIKAMGPGVRG